MLQGRTTNIVIKSWWNFTTPKCCGSNALAAMELSRTRRLRASLGKRRRTLARHRWAHSFVAPFATFERMASARPYRRGLMMAFAGARSWPGNLIPFHSFEGEVRLSLLFESTEHIDWCGSVRLNQRPAAFLEDLPESEARLRLRIDLPRIIHHMQKVLPSATRRSRSSPEGATSWWGGSVSAEFLKTLSQRCIARHQNLTVISNNAGVEDSVSASSSRTDRFAS